MTIQDRNQIDQKFTWNLNDIYQDENEFIKALEKAQLYPSQIMSYKGKIANDPNKLLEYLRLNDEISVEIGKLINYVERKSDEDTRISHYQDLSSQAMNTYIQIAASSSWTIPELLTITDQELETFMNQVSGLKIYRRYFERIFDQKAHTLSPDEENILARVNDLAQQPNTIYSLFNDADLSFPNAIDSNNNTYPVTHSTYVPLMMSPDRTLRESAYRSLYNTYEQFRNTTAALLAAQLKQQKFFADTRKYSSTLEQSLQTNEVPVAVYTNLIEAVHQNLDALHKYTALRKKVLNLDDLKFWDLYTPIVEDFNISFTYDQACSIILEALKPLGDKYLSIVKQALNNRWIDVYENKGKRSGAYSAGSYGMHPYMLLNFQGTLDDVYTLIHEMGHSIHTYLSCQNQPICYSSYVIFVAEVASTCNEALLTYWFLEHAKSKKEKAYILNHFLEQFRATLYRQTMFAEFELKINEYTAKGIGITADLLCKEYRKLNEEYYGNAIESDDLIALEWARIPHFYYEYYVYQYATGFAAAIALSDKILHGGQKAKDAYLNFLAEGCSKSPIDLLKDAGVDMTTPEPINQALKKFNSLVDEMSSLLQEII